MNRSRNLTQLEQGQEWDVVIIGGGASGLGIAAVKEKPVNGGGFGANNNGVNANVGNNGQNNGFVANGNNNTNGLNNQIVKPDNKACGRQFIFFYNGNWCFHYSSN